MSEIEEPVLTAEDRDNMRLFLELIYPNAKSAVRGWEMNDAVFEIVTDMVDVAVDCSNLMDRVPRPTDLVGARGSARYVSKVLASIAKRVRDNQRGESTREIYIVCRDAVAINYRTPLELAGHGL